jgi:hypothetical protein
MINLNWGLTSRPIKQIAEIRSGVDDVFAISGGRGRSRPFLPTPVHALDDEKQCIDFVVVEGFDISVEMDELSTA